MARRKSTVAVTLSTEVIAIEPAKSDVVSQFISKNRLQAFETVARRMHEKSINRAVPWNKLDSEYRIRWITGLAKMSNPKLKIVD